MSAAVLEQRLSALESRLEQEIDRRIQPLEERLHQIEKQLGIGRTGPPKAEVPRAAEPVQPVVLGVPPPQCGNWVETSPTAIDVGDGDGTLAAETRDEELVPFAETVCNVGLVLGHSGAGWIDCFIACLLTALGTCMQAIFLNIIMSSAFLGATLDEQAEAAQNWRAQFGHDVKYMDFSLTSLVSRVCDDAPSLILSTDQASFIKEINQYLGLSAGQFDPANFPPGITLCMLCITLYCVVLAGELRAIATSLVAALQIPRARETVMDDGRFVSISYVRFAFYLLFRLAQTILAVCLLFAGIQWLARTTSITDLILNAVALEAILQVDEVIFATVFPKKIQAAISSLGPIKVQYTRRFSQVETSMIALMLCVALLVPFFLLVNPITDKMRSVKMEYCGGNQDFVMSLNPEMQIYIGFATTPSRNSSTDELGRQASLEHAKERLVNETVSKYISFSASLRDFETDRAASMKTAATIFPSCLDYDQWTTELHAKYGPHFRTAAFQFGRPHASSCADLMEFCDLLGARLLRMVCSRTCACADPRALPWFKVPSQGCPAACREEAAAKAAELPCSNANNAENWNKFWSMYPLATSALIEEDSWAANKAAFVNMMNTLGCLGLAAIGPIDRATGAKWCDGSDELFSPLALICPMACGCTTATPLLLALVAASSVGMRLRFPRMLQQPVARKPCPLAFARLSPRMRGSIAPQHVDSATPPPM